MTTEYIPYLTVAAAWAVPLLTETAKKRFGAAAEGRTAQHEKHAEIMAELAAARAEMKDLRHRADVAEERVIALLRENAGQTQLVTALTDLLRPTSGLTLEPYRPDSSRPESSRPEGKP